MGSNSTVYDVRVKYSMDDKASSGMKSLTNATKGASSEAMTLKEALMGIGAFAIAKKGLELGKELLIDFNSEMDRLKNSMTVVMQMNMHMPFEKATASANKLFETFQAMAKKSPLMTKDYMEMASALAPAVSMAGGGVGKLTSMTQGALGAGLAYNVRPEQMAMDIQEMLAGNVRLTSHTARQMIASTGMDHKEFNALSASDRAKTTEKILTDPAILAATERASHTLAGESSTFKDNIQIALGEVGRPLMAEMTASMKQINQWVEHHPKLIKEWVTSFSNTLKSGFEWLKNIAGFFIEHKDLLLSLAKTFVAFKGAQMAGNVFRSFTDGVGGLAGSLKKGIEAIRGGTGASGMVSAFGGLGSMATGLVNKVIPALGLFTGALEIATHFLGDHAEENRKAKEAAIDINEATEDYPTLKTREKQLMTAQTRDGDLGSRYQTELEGIQKQLYSPEKLGLAIRKISEASEKHGGISMKNLTTDQLMSSNLLNTIMPKGGLFTTDAADKEKSLQVLEQVKEVLTTMQKTGVMENGMVLDKILKYAFPEQYGMPTPEETKAPGEEWKGVSAKDINVTINKIEVASEDPDRFVFGLAQIANNAVKHPTQSQHSVTGGF